MDAMRNEVLDIVKQLSARPDVEYAQPAWILRRVATPGDPRYGEQWHYFNNGSGAGESPGGINLPKAWDTGTGNPAVVVAVIDTGILPNHPDITGSPNLGAGYDMITDVFTANDGNGRDSDPTDPGDAVAANECGPGAPAERDSWHGTHVAGTVGVGNTNNSTGVAGVNWMANVLPVRVLGKCGGSIVDINDAIRWAAGLPVPGVPANATPAKVINMSLGGPVPCSASPSTQSAINDAVAAGTTVVVAAGNSATDAAGDLPAGCDNVITVAASDARGHLVGRYSNFGATVEIMAPGGDVVRDDTGDGNPDGVLSMIKGGYAYYNGTSMAAPHVAGVAALLLAQDASRSPADILSLIQANALPRSTTQCPKPCGAGLLNAHFPGMPQERFQYAAKLVCGIQRDPKNMQLARGFYGTTVNLLNPGREKTQFTKELALTIPPGGQKPGEIFQVATDTLGPHQALATDCEDIRRRVFGGTFPTPFIEGYVVIRSRDSLDVTGVYTTAALDVNGTAGDHSSMHVEQIRERQLTAGQPPDGKKADLTVREIHLDTLAVDCPTGAGSCVTKVEVTIANLGAANAGPFATRTTLDPAQSVTVTQASGGLASGAAQTFTVTTPAGGNCFDPDCQICVTVDYQNDVMESDETNNSLCKTKRG
jgi:serine protease